MPLTRRQFLIGVGATAGTGAAAIAAAEWMKGLDEAPPPATPMPRDNTSYSTGSVTLTPTPPANVAPPSEVAFALTRMTFGARPGDVERVSQMGLDNYIEQQLHPEAIDDSATDKLLEAYPTLNLSIAELYDGYPQPKPQDKPKNQPTPS
ncbi:MAG: DUF1800 family protein, partial [Chloroflexi bacterium]|nr:DUF1800 family protein [Chloroflexota bacterium]